MKKYAIILVIVCLISTLVACASGYNPDAETGEPVEPDISDTVVEPSLPETSTEDKEETETITPSIPEQKPETEVTPDIPETDVIEPPEQEEGATPDTETETTPMEPVEPTPPETESIAPPTIPVIPTPDNTTNTKPSMPPAGNNKPETTPEEKPDIVTDIKVKFYNEYSDSYNRIDGAKWCADIAALLQKHAPKGLRISCGVAMSYTEGGSGKKGVYAKTNNCFGIRATAGFKGPVYARSDGKVYKDYATALKYGASDLFRAYYSIEDSVLDYIAHMKNNRYGACLNIDNNKDYLEYIVNAGYCESGMASVWLEMIDLYNLDQYNIDWDATT